MLPSFPSPLRQAPLILTALWLAGCVSKPVQPPTLPAASTAPPPAAPAPAVKSDAERQADFDRSMARWHGAKVKELVAKLGAPNTRSRLSSGEWVYTYARSSTVRGRAGPERFSCVVNYRVDARGEMVVGHRIEGC